MRQYIHVSAAELKPEKGFIRAVAKNSPEKFSEENFQKAETQYAFYRIIKYNKQRGGSTMNEDIKKNMEINDEELDTVSGGAVLNAVNVFASAPTAAAAPIAAKIANASISAGINNAAANINSAAIISASVNKEN